jgi:hypothetical protein
MSCRRGMDHGLTIDTRKQGAGLTYVPLPIDNNEGTTRSVWIHSIP